LNKFISFTILEVEGKIKPVPGACNETFVPYSNPASRRITVFMSADVYTEIYVAFSEALGFIASGAP
jgi:hypothetical protein